VLAGEAASRSQVPVAAGSLRTARTSLFYSSDAPLTRPIAAILHQSAALIRHRKAGHSLTLAVSRCQLLVTPCDSKEGVKETATKVVAPLCQSHPPDSWPCAGDTGVPFAVRRTDHWLQVTDCSLQTTQWLQFRAKSATTSVMDRAHPRVGSTSITPLGAAHPPPETPPRPRNRARQFAPNCR